MPNLKVIDISHHNTVDPGGFEKMYAFGIRGVIFKATQGVAYIDPTAKPRAEAAKKAGLLIGFYHFATADDVDLQVKHFLDVAGADANTLMALDHEPNKGNELDLDGAQAFLESARDQLGRKLVLYSGNLIKEQLGDADSEFFGSHKLWLAHYNNKPKWPPAWDNYFLHQFSGDGVNNNEITVPGINPGNQIDMDSYAGTDEELTNEWASC